MAEPDETDARFRALIRAEYGDETYGFPSDEDLDDEPAPPRPVVPFSALPPPRSWVPPEEEDEPFTPPPVEPGEPMSTAAVLAGLLLVAAAVVGILTIARLPLPWWVPPAGLACFVGGAVLAFSRLPRDHDDRPDDGAVV